MEFRELYAGDIGAVAADIARLRIAIFREFPYLYDGDMESEQGYMESLIGVSSTYVATYSVENEIVGAITCYSLSDAQDEVAEAYAMRGEDLSEICYFGEVLLLKEFRGSGVGSKLVDMAERHALDRGYSSIALCAVDRAIDHPLRPADYIPIDRLLAHREYTKIPDIKSIIEWREVGGEIEEHSLSIWQKKIKQ